jgi:hypothetical protein
VPHSQLAVSTLARSQGPNSGKEKQRISKDTLETEQVYLHNKDCEEALTKALRKALKQLDGDLSLERATLELFVKPTSPLLKLFYQVRKESQKLGGQTKARLRAQKMEL